MGEIMRRHWLPACMSEEVPEADGDPIKIRLLGEDLVVFRDTEGRLGVMDELCPHRRASLLFGRRRWLALSLPWLENGCGWQCSGNVLRACRIWLARKGQT